MRLIFSDDLPGHCINLVKLDAAGDRIAMLDRRGGADLPLVVYECSKSIWTRVPTPGFDELPLCLAFSPEGSRVLLSTEHRLVTFDVGEHEMRECDVNGGGGASELEWIDEDLVAAAFPERWPPLYLLSRANRSGVPLTPPFGEIAKHIPRIAVSHDTKTIAFCHAFEFVYFFDLPSGNPTLWGAVPEPVSASSLGAAPWTWAHFARRIWFSEDDTEFAVAGQPRDRDEWAQMEIHRGKVNDSKRFPLRLKSHMGSVDVSPDFNIVAAAVMDRPGEVALWDTKKDVIIDVIRMGKPTRDIRFSRDGTILVISCEDSISIFER
jgi:WD40 repeat protein